MAMTALFRGKWGQKTQEAPAEKRPAAVEQPSHDEDDDDDDPKHGFSRETIRRNSRFYRSMRKKKPAQSDQSESKGEMKVSILLTGASGHLVLLFCSSVCLFEFCI